MIFQSPALSCFCGHLKMNYEGVTTSNVCYCSHYVIIIKENYKKSSYYWEGADCIPMSGIALM